MLIISGGLYAQKMNAVKTDLFSAFLRTGVFKYERAFNENISAQLGFFYTGYSPGDPDAKLNGIGNYSRIQLLFIRYSGTQWDLPGS